MKIGDMTPEQICKAMELTAREFHETGFDGWVFFDDGPLSTIMLRCRFRHGNIEWATHGKRLVFSSKRRVIAVLRRKTVSDHIPHNLTETALLRAAECNA